MARVRDRLDRAAGGELFVERGRLLDGDGGERHAGSFVAFQGRGKSELTKAEERSGEWIGRRAVGGVEHSLRTPLRTVPAVAADEHDGETAAASVVDANPTGRSLDELRTRRRA